MAQFKDIESKARTWATAHVVAAVIIGAVFGFIVRSLL